MAPFARSSSIRLLKCFYTQGTNLAWHLTARQSRKHPSSPLLVSMHLQVRCTSFMPVWLRYNTYASGCSCFGGLVSASPGCWGQVDKGLHPDLSTQSLTPPQDGAVRSDLNTSPTGHVLGPSRVRVQPIVQPMLQASPTEKLNMVCVDTVWDKNQA